MNTTAAPILLRIDASARSDSLIAELKGAQTVPMCVPVYNFSLPSSLKASIDQIVRIGVTAWRAEEVHRWIAGRQ